MLQVDADLEHVLASPVVPRHRQRFDELQAADVALLAVEEVAALRLRRVDHRQRALGRLVDLEQAAGERRLQHGVCRRGCSRSTKPAEKPDCVNFGVVSGGRKVDIVALVIFRGK